MAPLSVDGRLQAILTLIVSTVDTIGVIWAGTSSALIVTVSENSPHPNEFDALTLKE